MKKLLILSTCFATSLQFASYSYAATKVGEIEKADGSARASGAAGKRALTTGSDIFKGDTITTGIFDRLHVKFSDQTKLVIGPNSKIKVAQFVGGSGGTASTFAIKAARGAFRFISGKSSKSAYKISTRSATIGIRGTGFDFTDRSGTSVVLYNGSVIVCAGGSCQTLSQKCDMARQQGGSVRKSTTAELVPNAFRLTFPFIRSEASILPSYRLNSGACDSGTGAGPKGGEDNGGQGGRGGSEGNSS